MNCPKSWTIAEGFELVARVSWGTLNLMENQLHSNRKMIHQTFSDDLGSRNIFAENGWQEQSLSMWRLHCEMLEISHPSYSLDLMLAALFLFPKWKLPQSKKISGHRRKWKEYNLHSKYIPLDAFTDYVLQPIEQYKECVAVKGDYFEGK